MKKILRKGKNINLESLKEALQKKGFNIEWTETISEADAYGLYPNAYYWVGMESSEEEDDYWVVDIQDEGVKVTPLPRREEVREYASGDEPQRYENDYNMSEYISDTTVGFVHWYRHQRDWEDEPEEFIEFLVLE